MMYGGTSCSIAHGRTFTHLYARRSIVECILCHNVIVAHLHSPTQSSRIQLGRDFDSGQPKQNRDCRAVCKIRANNFKATAIVARFSKQLITLRVCIPFIFARCAIYRKTSNFSLQYEPYVRATENRCRDRHSFSRSKIVHGDRSRW